MKAYDSISSYAEDSIWIKDYILDPLAWAAAKSMLQSITDETVNWINSGFNGSPAYITNPTSFFNNVADQATGAFLADNGPLSSLCSPISLNVRLAIALNEAGSRGTSGSAGASGGSGGSNSPYACTLSTAISNVNGATINGFEAGDFSQGGWPAFASLAEPQNNFYGAYLEAQSELDTNIANRTNEQNNQLNRGSGFMSYTTCKDDSTITDDDAAYDPTIQYDSKNNVYERCTISTPGSTIKSSLDKALGSSQDSLVQASMLDEVIGALASQLVNQVLGPNGLSGVTQSQNGQPSYLTQIEAEATTSNTTTVSNTASTLTTQISTYRENIVNQQNDYAASIDVANGAVITITSYEQVCENASNTPAVDQLAGLAATASSTADQLQSGDNSGTNYLNYNSTTDYLNNLDYLNSQINSAGSTADVNSLYQQIQSLNPTLQSFISSESYVKNSITKNDDASINSTLTQADTIVAECGGAPSRVTVTGSAAQNYTSSTDNSGGNSGLGGSFQP